MPSPVRFTSGVSTGAKGSALFNLPIPDPTKVHTYFNDFSNYVAGDWTVTETGTGSRALLADAPGGALLITNAAADNDCNEFQLVTENFTMSASKKAWFKARLKVSDATESDWLVGLAVLDTSIQGSVSGAGVTDGIFFNKDDGDALIDVQVQKNATTGQNRAAGIATNVSDTYVTLGWEYDGAGYLKYFVDEVHIGTLDASSSYLPDTPLTVSFAIQNGAGAAKTMTVDYVFAAIER